MTKKDPFASFPELKNYSVFFPMQHAMRILAGRLERLDAQHGLTINQFYVLLIANERLASQGLIAECLDINKNSMVELIDKMEDELHYVTRVQNSKNRKENLIQITPKGKDALRGLLKSQKDIVSEAFHPISTRDVRRMWDWAIEIIEAFHREQK